MRGAAVFAEGRPSRALLRALVLTGCVLGCACASPPRPPPARAPRPLDDAVELAALLPDGIDRCVITRPRRLAARRRALVVYHSWAEPWVWDRELPIRAYATALAERADGRRARRTYVRFATDVDEASLDRLPVRWIDEDCDGIACRLPVARFLDPRTVEITRHAWPRHGTRESSARCVSGARREIEAFEVAVDASATRGPSGFAPPRFVERVLRGSGRGLSFTTVSAFRDPVEADLVESWIRERGPFVESSLVPLPPNDRRVSRHGNRVTVVDTRRFEELELALEDEQLRRRAYALSQRRAEPLPVAEVDVSRISVVRHQVRQRRMALERAQGSDRVAEAEALAALLERVAAAQPHDGAFLAQLVRVCLDELLDPRRALRHIESAGGSRAVTDPGMTDPGVSLALLRREALSRVEGDAFTRALLEEGIVRSAVEAELAADDIRALTDGGVGYEWAEGAFQTSRALLEGPPPRVATRARLRLEGLVGALLVHARLDVQRDDLRVQVAVHAEDDGAVQVIGDATPELIVVHGRGGAGRVLVAAAPSGDVVRWRRIGARLHDAVSPGPLVVAVDLTDAAGHPVRRMRVRGRLSGDEVEIAAVDDSLAAADWAVLSRYVARPLAELPIALFPPPDLVVSAETEETLAAVVRAVRDRPSFAIGACQARGTSLVCRSRARMDVDDLLMAMVRARLGLRQGADAR